MALNAQLHSNFSDLIIQEFITKRFLDILRPELQLEPLGMKETLPQHTGKVVDWNRPVDFAANTTPITEGVDPDGLNLSFSNVSVTLAQYADFVAITDWFQMQAVNDIVLSAVDTLGHRAAKSIDALIRNEADTFGTQNYVSPDTNTSKALVESNATKIQTQDVIRMLFKLRNNNVPVFPDGNYRGVIHTRMEFDLLSEADTQDFIVLASQSSGQIIERGTIGNMFGTKLLRSTDSVRADAAEANTYGNLFFGLNAYSTVNMASAGLEIIRKAFNEGGSANPLNLRATVGYKFVYAAKVMQAVRMQVLWAFNNS